MTWRVALRHAFAVEKPGAVEPTDAQRRVVERVVAEVRRRGLTTPAIVFLEMSRPLNYVSAQAMHFFQPIVAAILDTAAYDHFTEFLEHRGSIEYLVARLEEPGGK
jgi:hypothetical protein